MASVGTTGRRTARQAEAAGEDVARSKQLEWLARAGLVARGVVYGLIGILAVKVAFGVGGKTTDQQGALKTIAGQPFGKVLLVLVAIGLAGYALWRLVRAAIGHGPETGEDDAKDRISGLVSGIAYAALCVTAVKILIGELEQQQLEQDREGDRRRARLAARPVPRHRRGARRPRRRRRPGAQGDQAEVPRGLEDRADEPGRRPGVHRGRRLRAPRAGRRLRPDRLVRHQGRHRLRPRQGGRPRPGAGEAQPRARSARSCSASWPRG